MEKREIQGVQDFDKTPMLSNHQTVSHTPDKFVIDFKNVYSQFAPDNNPPAIIINHKVVLLDPFVAKEFLNVLAENIRKFEEKFGKIKLPDSVQKARKEMQKVKPEESISTTDRPSYMG